MENVNNNEVGTTTEAVAGLATEKANATAEKKPTLDELMKAEGKLNQTLDKFLNGLLDRKPLSPEKQKMYAVDNFFQCVKTLDEVYSMAKIDDPDCVAGLAKVKEAIFRELKRLI